MIDSIKPGLALAVQSLVVGYGKKQVLDGVSLEIASGEIVAVIGHNGAGKSTLLKTIFGLVPVWQGRIQFGATPLKSPTPRQLLCSGIAYVPQGNRVFGDLTVRESLEVGGSTLSNRAALNEAIERVFILFPRLKSRPNQRAGTLSGGEKQMLALASALILSPRLLLLDEPSQGLAPPLVSEALARLQEINQINGVSVLIVEQKVRQVLKVVRRVYVLRNGRIAFSGLSEDLKEDTKLREVYL